MLEQMATAPKPRRLDRRPDESTAEWLARIARYREVRP
jgi:hypothetical protein